jgi:hypothetical protein
MLSSDHELLLVALHAARAGLRAASREIVRAVQQTERERDEAQVRASQLERQAIAQELCPGWQPGQAGPSTW